MNKKKKMGFFTLHYDPPIGGAERSMHNYFKELSSQIDIHVFCFLNEDGRGFPSYSLIEKDGVHIHKCSKPINNILSHFLKKENPDMVATQLLGSDLVVEMCHSAGIPVYYFAHGLFEDVCQHYLLTSCPEDNLLTCGFGPSCPNAFQHKRNHLKYQKCEKIFCNSDYTKKIFERMYPDVSDKISVVYPNMNFDLFYKKRSHKIRDNNTILAVNSMPTKGRNIIKAFAELHPEIKVIYIDCKPDDIEFLKSATNIETYGRLPSEKMEELYRSVGAVVCPTFMQETFGGVVAEAILTETPVVCMNKGNLSNLVVNGRNGFILNSMNIHEWSEKIIQATQMKVEAKHSDRLYEKLNMEENLNIIKEEMIKESVVEQEGGEVSEVKRKKIVFFARFFYPPLGGGEYFILSVFKHLKHLGYDCIGAGYCNPETNAVFMPGEEGVIDWDGIPAHKLIINNVSDIQNFYLKEKPDLIVTHSYDAPVFVDLAKRMGIKTILGTHFWRNICEVNNDFSNMLERSPATFRLTLNNHRVFDTADQLYVNSEFMKRGVKRYTGRVVDRIIHPILDVDRVVSLDRKNDNAKYVTIVNPDRGKGGNLFLDIAAKMPNTNFMCVGLGAEICPKNRQINLIIKNRPNIKLIEKTDNMAEVYKETKILLAPSLVDETFSMVALEAMANGIPVLASPNGNLKFLIEDGGRLLDSRDVNLWVDNINNVLTSEEEYDSLSLGAKNTARKYDPQKELKTFEDMVKECIGDPV